MLPHWMACALLSLRVGLWVCPAHAHDLNARKLVLRVEPTVLRGELSLPGASVAVGSAAELERAVAQALVLHMEERAATPVVTALDLAPPVGDAPAHLVELRWPRPSAARRFTVTLRAASSAPGAAAVLRDVRVLALSVEQSQRDDLSVHSVLLMAGETSPAYPLRAHDSVAAEPRGWQAGGIDQLHADAGVPSGPSDVAASRAPSASDTLPSNSGVPSQAAARTDSIQEGFAESTSGVVWRYARLGFLHILPLGLDHILFVVGLVLLSRQWRPLLLQLSLFTAAHTTTLALSALQILRLSPLLVEPIIALSIAYVGVENLLSPAPLTRAHWRRRGALVFAFGLIHGLGFAGVLADIGLAEQHFLLSLFSFNAGVELGQIAVVAAVLLPLLPLQDPILYRRWVLVPGSIAISLAGGYWGVTRILAG